MAYPTAVNNQITDSVTSVDSSKNAVMQELAGRVISSLAVAAQKGLDETEQAYTLVDLIRMVIEPDGWRANGGDWASIQFYQGALIVRAPDFIHRQIRPDRALLTSR